MRRYESYKDSGVEWLGEVPEHWEVKKLKYLAKLSPSKSEITCNHEESCSFIPMEKLKLNTLVLDEIKQIKNVYSAYTYFRDEDLLIAKVTPCFENKNFAIAKNLVNSIGFGSSEIYVLRTYNNLLNKFLFYRLQEQNFMKIAISKMSGTGGLKRVPSEFINNFQLALPPFSEQQKIAQFLDEKTAKIDQAVDLAEKQIALLKEHKQILIQNAVTRGLNPDVPLKDSGVEWIGQVPEHWEVKKIKHVTSKIGSGITPLGGGSNYIDGGIPLLRSQNIHFDRIDLNDVARISEFTHNSMKNSKVRKGDVLLNITGGSLGRCFYVDSNEEMNVNQHVCIIRPNKKINTIFLNMLLASEIGQKQIWFFQQGGGREGLNFQAIKNFYLPLPDLEEQQKIAIYLDKQAAKIDQAIALKTAHIEKLKEYKSVLINDVVTGKVRV